MIDYLPHTHIKKRIKSSYHLLTGLVISTDTRRGRANNLNFLYQTVALDFDK